MKLEELGKLQILTYTFYRRYQSNAGLCSELRLIQEYSRDDFYSVTVVTEIQ